MDISTPMDALCRGCLRTDCLLTEKAFDAHRNEWMPHINKLEYCFKDLTFKDYGMFLLCSYCVNSLQVSYNLKRTIQASEITLNCYKTAASTTADEPFSELTSAVLEKENNSLGSDFQRVVIKSEPLEDNYVDVISDLDEFFSADNTNTSYSIEEECSQEEFFNFATVKCTYCDQRFLDDRSLQLHRCTHFDKKTAEKAVKKTVSAVDHQCKHCQEIFSNDLDLALHLHVDHAKRVDLAPAFEKPAKKTVRKKRNCKLCNVKMKSHDEYVRHMKDMHGDKSPKRLTRQQPLAIPAKKIYKCRLCDQLFHDITHLKIHEAAKHRHEIGSGAASSGRSSEDSNTASSKDFVSSNEARETQNASSSDTQSSESARISACVANYQSWKKNMRDLSAKPASYVTDAARKATKSVAAASSVSKNLSKPATTSAEQVVFSNASIVSKNLPKPATTSAEQVVFSSASNVSKNFQKPATTSAEQVVFSSASIISKNLKKPATTSAENIVYSNASIVSPNTMVLPFMSSSENAIPITSFPTNIIFINAPPTDQLSTTLLPNLVPMQTYSVRTGNSVGLVSSLQKGLYAANSHLNASNATISNLRLVQKPSVIAEKRTSFTLQPNVASNVNSSQSALFDVLNNAGAATEIAQSPFAHQKVALNASETQNPKPKSQLCTAVKNVPSSGSDLLLNAYSGVSISKILDNPLQQSAENLKPDNDLSSCVANANVSDLSIFKVDSTLQSPPSIETFDSSVGATQRNTDIINSKASVPETLLPQRIFVLPQNNIIHLDESSVALNSENVNFSVREDVEKLSAPVTQANSVSNISSSEILSPKLPPAPSMEITEQNSDMPLLLPSNIANDKSQKSAEPVLVIGDKSNVDVVSMPTLVQEKIAESTTDKQSPTEDVISALLPKAKHISSTPKARSTFNKTTLTKLVQKSKFTRSKIKHTFKRKRVKVKVKRTGKPTDTDDSIETKRSLRSKCSEKLPSFYPFISRPAKLKHNPDKPPTHNAGKSKKHSKVSTSKVAKLPKVHILNDAPHVKDSKTSESAEMVRKVPESDPETIKITRVLVDNKGGSSELKSEINVETQSVISYAVVKTEIKNPEFISTERNDKTLEIFSEYLKENIPVNNKDGKLVVNSINETSKIVDETKDKITNLSAKESIVLKLNSEINSSKNDTVNKSAIESPEKLSESILATSSFEEDFQLSEMDYVKIDSALQALDAVLVSESNENSYEIPKFLINNIPTNVPLVDLNAEIDLITPDSSVKRYPKRSSTLVTPSKDSTGTVSTEKSVSKLNKSIKSSPSIVPKVDNKLDTEKCSENSSDTSSKKSVSKLNKQEKDPPSEDSKNVKRYPVRTILSETPEKQLDNSATAQSSDKSVLKIDSLKKVTNERDTESKRYPKRNLNFNTPEKNVEFPETANKSKSSKKLNFALNSTENEIKASPVNGTTFEKNSLLSEMGRSFADSDLDANLNKVKDETFVKHSFKTDLRIKTSEKPPITQIVNTDKMSSLKKTASKLLNIDVKSKSTDSTIRYPKRSSHSETLSKLSDSISNSPSKPPVSKTEKSDDLSKQTKVKIKPSKNKLSKTNSSEKVFDSKTDKSGSKHSSSMQSDSVSKSVKSDNTSKEIKVKTTPFKNILTKTNSSEKVSNSKTDKSGSKHSSSMRPDSVSKSEKSDNTSKEIKVNTTPFKNILTKTNSSEKVSDSKTNKSALKHSSSMQSDIVSTSEKSVNVSKESKVKTTPSKNKLTKTKSSEKISDSKTNKSASKQNSSMQSDSVSTLEKSDYLSKKVKVNITPLKPKLIKTNSSEKISDSKPNKSVSKCSSSMQPESVFKSEKSDNISKAIKTKTAHSKTPLSKSNSTEEISQSKINKQAIISEVTEGKGISSKKVLSKTNSFEKNTPKIEVNCENAVQKQAVANTSVKLKLSSEKVDVSVSQNSSSKIKAEVPPKSKKKLNKILNLSTKISSEAIENVATSPIKISTLKELFKSKLSHSPIVENPSSDENSLNPLPTSSKKRVLNFSENSDEKTSLTKIGRANKKLKSTKSSMTNSRTAKKSKKCKKRFSLHLKAASNALSKHRCTFCLRKHRSAASLKKHQLLRHRKDLGKCRYCCSSLPNPSALRAHERSHKRPYACSSCPKAFALEAHRTEHQNVHGETFTCSLCFKDFKSEGFFKKHLALHRMSGNGFYDTCHVCKQVFKAWQLVEHKKKNKCTAARRAVSGGGGGGAAFVCPFCPKDCKRASAYGAHVKLHVFLKCSACFGHFRSYRAVRKHVTEKHRNVRRSVRVTVAVKTLKRIKAVRKRNVSRKHRCDSCYKCFSCKALYDTHIFRRHLVNNKCKLCKKIYFYKGHKNRCRLVQRL